MTDKITFRLLAKNDLEGYRKLRIECLKAFPDNFGTTYQEEIDTNRLLLTEAIKNAGNDSFFMGAFLDEQELIGFCGFIAEPRLKARHRGELVQMYVSPKYSGRGIGRKLIKLTIQKAFENLNMEQIVLGVTDENTKAKQLYQEIGFKEYGKLENYFKTESSSITQCFMCFNKTDYDK